MTTYRLSDTPSPQYSRLKWQLPLFTVGFVIAAMACSKFGNDWRERFPQAPDSPHAISLFLLAGAFILGVAFVFLLRNYQKKRAQFLLRISPEGVFRQWPPLPDMFLPRETIMGFIERKPGRGFAIRSTDRRQIMAVPSDLAGYEECQSELISTGIPKLPFEARRDVWPAIAPMMVMLLALAAYFSSSRLEVIAGLAGFLVVLFWVGQRTGRLRDFTWWLTFALTALLITWNNHVLGGWHSLFRSSKALDLLILSLGLIALAQGLYAKWHKPKT